MRKLEIVPELLTKGAQLLGQESPAQGEGKRYLLQAGKEGAGICTPWLSGCRERYFTLKLKAQETHSVALNLLLYGKESERAGYDRALRHSAAGGDAGLF